MATLVPLARGTLDSVLATGLTRSMGGPAARGDVGTVRRHLAALERADPEVALTYGRLLLKGIPMALARGSLSPDRASKVEALLASAIERLSAEPE